MQPFSFDRLVFVMVALAVCARIAYFWPPIHLSRGAYRKSPPGYSVDQSPTPYNHPFRLNWGLTAPSRFCGQTMPDITAVCIDTLWEDTIALPKSTIVEPLGAPFSKKGVVKNTPSIGHIVGFPYLLVYVIRGGDLNCGSAFWLICSLTERECRRRRRSETRARNRVNLFDR